MTERDNLPQETEPSSIDELMNADVAGLTEALTEAQAQALRYAIVFDATSSMGVYWDEIIKGLKGALDEIKSRVTAPLSINIVAYRDHCDGRSVVEESGYTVDFTRLKDWLRDVACKGGGDEPEAVDVGLQKLLQRAETPRRVVVIGDAPPHERQPAIDEAKTLKFQGCEVYTIACIQRPMRAFTAIAEAGGGKAFLLQNIGDMVDILATIISRDKALLKAAVAGLLPYEPRTEAGRLIAGQV